MKTAKPRFKVMVGEKTGCMMPRNAWCYSVLDQRTLDRHYSSDAVEGIKSHAAEMADKGFQKLADRLLAQLV